uniref:Protein arginine N-methyltransferase 1.5 n=1 Tax=Rhizophora mucronata TaxID=61149 RepID=A0A2P2MP23_RHIMU
MYQCGPSVRRYLKVQLLVPLVAVFERVIRMSKCKDRL